MVEIAKDLNINIKLLEDPESYTYRVFRAQGVFDKGNYNV